MTERARLANQTTAEFDSLFPKALDFFDSLCLHLQRYGIQIPDGIVLEQTDGLFPYYNFENGHIYVAIPNQTSGTGKLHKIFIRSVLLCEDDWELLTLFEVFIPFMIAHEFGHALRHQYGLYEPTAAWKEEQIANQFAAAVIQRHLPLGLKTDCQRLIYRALQSMGAKMEDQTAPGSSHHSLLYALHSDGEITDQTLENLQVMEKLFAAQAEDILLNTSGTAGLVTERLNKREEIVRAFDDNRADNVSKYMYYLLGWLYYNLTSHQDIYIDEFARVHLGHTTQILPSVEGEREPTLDEIRACFQAALCTRSVSEIGYRYFYKRYRSRILDKLRRQTPEQFPGLGEETIDFFEGWEDDDTDTLDYLAQFVDPAMRPYLPGNLADDIDLAFNPSPHLSAETDRRLWNYLIHNKADQEAAETLVRLGLLEQISIFKTLPAEILLTLADNFYRIKLDTGEALIREGNTDRNVYILLDGSFDVFVNNTAGQLQHLHATEKGGIFGEMAFFTRQPRSASVIATEPSTCYILKSTDLRFLLYKYPIIAISMGIVLAEKLQDATTLIQDFKVFEQNV